MNKSIIGLSEKLAKIFHRYVIKLESIPGEPELIGAGVYGVEKENVPYVSKMICEISDELFPLYEVELIPLVRSEETTNQYYPEFSRIWNWHKTVLKYIYPPCKISIENKYLENHISSLYQSKREKTIQRSMDEQLALAA